MTCLNSKYERKPRATLYWWWYSLPQSPLVPLSKLGLSTRNKSFWGHTIWLARIQLGESRPIKLTLLNYLTTRDFKTVDLTGRPSRLRETSDSGEHSALRYIALCMITFLATSIKRLRPHFVRPYWWRFFSCFNSPYLAVSKNVIYEDRLCFQ